MVTVEQMRETINNLGYSVRESTISRNGIEMPCWVLGSDKVAPTIYPDRLIDTFESIESFEFYIMDIFRNIPEFNTEDVMDWENVKDKVVLCVQKATSEDMPKRAFDDLELYVRIILNFEASVKVTRSLMSNWDISEDEVIEKAISNTSNNYEMFNIGQALPDVIDEDIDDLPMYILTVKSRRYGASAIHDSLYLDNVCKDLGCDHLYIIPSSIHELILIPGSEGVDEEYLNYMVREVNSECVDPTEILSDHVYIHKIA